MSKHTPGPWVPVDAISHGCSFIHIHGPEMEDIAMTGVNQEAIDDQQRANARLIAAAPELLVVLKEIVRFVGGDETDARLLRVTPEWLACVRAVIAKAEGK